MVTNMFRPLMWPYLSDFVDNKNTVVLFILTSALEGVGGARYALAILHPPLPGKTRYPLYRRLGGPQGRSGRMRKNSPHRDSIPVEISTTNISWGIKAAGA